MNLSHTIPLRNSEVTFWKQRLVQFGARCGEQLEVAGRRSEFSCNGRLLLAPLSTRRHRPYSLFPRPQRPLYTPQRSAPLRFSVAIRNEGQCLSESPLNSSCSAFLASDHPYGRAPITRNHAFRRQGREAEIGLCPAFDRGFNCFVRWAFSLRPAKHGRRCNHGSCFFNPYMPLETKLLSAQQHRKLSTFSLGEETTRTRSG